MNKPLHPSLVALRSRLAKRPRARVQLPGFRESAVLVPLLLDADAVTQLLYIVRTSDLPTHAGQIAFPGGKREHSDLSLEDTALRETSEEVGIEPGRVELIGCLDDVPTPMGFVITPVVGVIHGPLTLTPSQREVAETFTAPLHGLPDVYRHGGHAQWQGHSYVMHEFHHEQRRIWGATAAITMQLLHLLDLVELPPRKPGDIR